LAISLSDRRIIILEDIRHQRDLSAIREAERRHMATRAHVLDEAEKVKEQRRQTMIEHDLQNAIKKEARTAEVEAHQDFLKASMKKSLNIL
jgi:hypothetical protein